MVRLLEMDRRTQGRIGSRSCLDNETTWLQLLCRGQTAMRLVLVPVGSFWGWQPTRGGLLASLEPGSDLGGLDRVGGDPGVGPVNYRPLKLCTVGGVGELRPVEFALDGVEKLRRERAQIGCRGIPPVYR